MARSTVRRGSWVNLVRDRLESKPFHIVDRQDGIVLRSPAAGVGAGGVVGTGVEIVGDVGADRVTRDIGMDAGFSRGVVEGVGDIVTNPNLVPGASGTTAATFAPRSISSSASVSPGSSPMLTLVETPAPNCCAGSKPYHTNPGKDSPGVTGWYSTPGFSHS